MSSTVSIIMYHYIRDLSKTRFPLIRGRTIDEFRFQLDHLRNIGTFISAQQLTDAVLYGADLPKNSFMLSFDDGYADHFTNALPIIHEMGIEGMFFPPAQPIFEDRVMDVNKIHFVLASEPDTRRIVEFIQSWVTRNKTEFGLPSAQELWDQFAQASKYESRAVRFIKLILQRGLPRTARNILTKLLFRHYVTEDETAFSQELYLSLDQLKLMSRLGQYVGSHGYSHEWFDVLGPVGRKVEIEKSLQLLSVVGARTSDWIMSYPYGCRPFGAIDNPLRNLLRNHGCALALTDHGGPANVQTGDQYMISRIDTNEVPVG